MNGIVSQNMRNLGANTQNKLWTNITLLKK